MLMIGTTFRDYIRKKTKTTSDTFPDADLVLLANVEKDDLAEYIANEVGEDFFLLSYKRNLIAGQREYALPSQIMLTLKRVNAMFDGENWSDPLDELDVNQIRKPLITEANVQSAFAGREPAFDFTDRGLRLYSETPITDVTEGLQVESIIYPADITTGTLALATDISVPTSTITTAMPKASHKVWALMTSIAYKESRPKKIALTNEEKNIEAYKQIMINKLRGRNLDRSYVPTAPVDTGMNY